MLSYQSIINLFNVSFENITIIEHFLDSSVKLYCNNITFSSQNLLDIFKDIPRRDKITINLIYGDKSLAINLSTKAQTIDSFLDKLKQYVDKDDCFELEIKIIKKIQESTLSVYFFDYFSQWLFNLNSLEFVKAYNSILSKSKDSLTMECLNEKYYLYTNNFKIIPKGNMKSVISHPSERKRIISKRNQICRFSGFEIVLIPEDFNIIETNCGEKIKLNYEKAKYILSIAYLADECRFEKDDFSISLSGYRTWKKTVTYNSITTDNINNTFYSIYKWLYSGGNIHDKSQIVKNIISLHCKYSDILEITENVFGTIKSNYNLYLKENVKDYLNLKKDVVTSLQTFCNNISKVINDFTGSLKSNLIAMLGYIAAILFSKGITKNTTQIFTEDISILTSFVLVGSLAVFVLCLLHSNSQKKYCDSAIEELKLCYRDIMDDGEINQLIENNLLLITANTNFNKSTRRVSIAWIVSIIVLFIVLDKLSGHTKLLFIIDIF